MTHVPTPYPYHGKRGTTWRVRYWHRQKQGIETFGTKAEARRFCADIKSRGVDFALRMLREEKLEASGPTLDELAAQFFDWKTTRVRSDRTVADYRRDYRLAIQPVLGDRKAASIAEADIQQWADDLAGRLAPKTVADRHALLHAIYKWAAAPSRQLVTHNPCTETELPERRKRPPKGLKPAEWIALHRALKQIDPDAADFAEFMLATGWRFSEAAALGAYDVEDFGDSVWCTMSRVVRRDAAGRHVIVEDAKSEAGNRRVRLDPDAAEMVRRRLDWLTGDGLVFTTSTGAQWHYANFRNRAWLPAVRAANLSRRPTPHWLRHTAVAWLARSGAALPELQSRIGHEHISTTVDVYGRSLTDVDAETLAAFAAIRRVPELEH